MSHLGIVLPKLSAFEVLLIGSERVVTPVSTRRTKVQELRRRVPFSCPSGRFDQFELPYDLHSTITFITPLHSNDSGKALHTQLLFVPLSVIGALIYKPPSRSLTPTPK